MEIKAYITPLRKWWKLLVAAALVASISSFIVTSMQPSIYSAKTTLMIGRSLEDPNPTPNQFTLDRQLATIYADLANRDLIKNETMKALGISWLPEYEAIAVPNSLLLEISVVDTNPARAQAVANELANQLILNSPTGPQADQQARQDFIDAQLDSFQVQIQDTQAQITEQQELLGELNSASQIADTQDQILALQTKLNSLQATYASFLSNAQQGAANTISVMIPAELPVEPIGPNKILISLVAAAAGFVFAAGIAYLIEFSANTLKTPEEAEKLLNTTVLGEIPEIKAENKVKYATEFPFSPVAESFRSLRTNIEYMGADQLTKVIMVSSPGVAEGKSTIATNLAQMLARSERKVILVSADLRRPASNGILDNHGIKGLSDIFRGSLELETALLTSEDENLLILPAGTPPPNPTELLGSKKMKQILDKLREMADFIIIDSSPFLIADATVLAAIVDGVILIAQIDHTRKDALLDAGDKIRRVGGRLLGVVVNRINFDLSYTGKHYGSYGTYESLVEAPSESRNNVNGDEEKTTILSIFKNIKNKIQ